MHDLSNFMPSKSKNKGSGYERQVATFLSSIYKESFIRVPGSGAYIGGKNTNRKEILHEGQVRTFKGDIVPGQSFPKFNAECKFYADFPFHQLFSGGVKILESWIDQCMVVADPGDFNIIFMKFNRKGEYIATPYRDDLDKPCGLVYESINHGSWIFMDHDTFWEYNANRVKELCHG
jgi:hypothetical protein